MAPHNSWHSWVDIVSVLLILPSDVSYDSIMCWCSEKCIEIDNSNSSDEDRSALLVTLMQSVWQSLFDCSFFRELPSFVKVVYLFFLVPVHVVLNHGLYLTDVKLSCSAESECITLSKLHTLHIKDVFGLNPIYDLIHDVFLLRREVV